MGEVAYRSEITIERQKGGLRRARIPGEKEPVVFGMHGGIAEHYGRKEGEYDPHASTIDYVIAATGG
jgi:hypothetical protein